MKYTVFLFLLSLCCLFISCTDNIDLILSLNNAEAVMQERPDSALKILQTIETANIPYGELLARFALLFTQALDKNYLPIPNDSLIHIAVDYYSKEKDFRKLGWAYLYLGNAYTQIDSVNLAFTTYKKAQELLEKNPNDELWSLVSNEMGALFKEQRHYPQALELFRASLYASRRSGNLKNESYALGRIGDLFYVSKISLDSAEVYYTHARELAILRKDTAFCHLIDIDMCVLLRMKKQYREAMESLTNVIREMRGHHTRPLDYYPLLSALHLDLQQIDSARHYMQIMIRDTLATAKQRAAALTILKTVEEKAGNTEVALLYATQYKALSDSIQRVYIEHDIRVAEGQYLQHKLINEKTKQKAKDVIIEYCIVIVSVSCIIGVVLWLKRRILRQERHHAKTIALQQEVTRDLVQSSLLKGWNYTLLLGKYQSKNIDLTLEEDCSKVITTANTAFPGLLEWLKRFQLNNADTTLTFLLLSNFSPKELCAFYRIPDARTMYTRCSRLYKELGIKTTPRDPLSFRRGLINVYVHDQL